MNVSGRPGGAGDDGRVCGCVCFAVELCLFVCNGWLIAVSFAGCCAPTQLHLLPTSGVGAIVLLRSALPSFVD